MQSHRRAAIVLIALAASATLLGGMLLVAGGIGSALATTERASTSHQRVERIAIDVGDGDIDVVGVPGAREVRVVRTVKRFLGRPRFAQALHDGELRLHSECPGAILPPCRTDVRIETPPSVVVDAQSTAGNIEIRGLEGVVRARSTAGDVDLGAMRSPRVETESTAGDVEIDLLIAPERLAAVSTAGDVEVRVPAGRYDVEAATTAGDTRIEGLIDDPAVPRHLSVETTAGDATVRAR